MCFGSGSPVQQNLFAPLDLRWTVSARRVRNFTKELHELGVIGIDSKAGLNRFEILPMAVAGERRRGKEINLGVKAAPQCGKRRPAIAPACASSNY